MVNSVIEQTTPVTQFINDNENKFNTQFYNIGGNKSNFNVFAAEIKKLKANFSLIEIFEINLNFYQIDFYLFIHCRITTVITVSKNQGQVLHFQYMKNLMQ